MRMDTESSPGTLKKWMVFLGAALVPLASFLIVGPAMERWEYYPPIWLIPFVFFGPLFVLFLIQYWRSPRLGVYAALIVGGFLSGYVLTGITGIFLLFYLARGLGD